MGADRSQESHTRQYDKLDWHLDGAASAGEPPENAFTHIGFYLAWLIRHDLHNPDVLQREHVDAVKSGEMSGSDLADDIDTKLTSHVMNSRGRAFSDARFEAYANQYGRAFEDLPLYGVIDNGANYRRAEQLLDSLFADWIAAGRPKEPPTVRSEATDLTSTPGSAPMPPALTQELQGAFASWGDVEVAGLPAEKDMTHSAPELEALIPRDLTSPAMRVESVRASDWGSSQLNRVLRRLGTRPSDATVVSGQGGDGEQTLALTIYGVPRVSAEKLGPEFETVIYRLPGTKWQLREIGGQRVMWASGREFTVAYWPRDGVIMHVAGNAGAVQRAVERLV